MCTYRPDSTARVKRVVESSVIKAKKHIKTPYPAFPALQGNEGFPQIPAATVTFAGTQHLTLNSLSSRRALSVYFGPSTSRGAIGVSTVIGSSVVSTPSKITALCFGRRGKSQSSQTMGLQPRSSPTAPPSGRKVWDKRPHFSLRCCTPLRKGDCWHAPRTIKTPSLLPGRFLEQYHEGIVTVRVCTPGMESERGEGTSSAQTPPRCRTTPVSRRCRWGEPCSHVQHIPPRQARGRLERHKSSPDARYGGENASCEETIKRAGLAQIQVFHLLLFGGRKPHNSQTQRRKPVNKY